MIATRRADDATGGSDLDRRGVRAELETDPPGGPRVLRVARVACRVPVADDREPLADLHDPVGLRKATAEGRCDVARRAELEPEPHDGGAAVGDVATELEGEVGVVGPRRGRRDAVDRVVADPGHLAECPRHDRQVEHADRAPGSIRDRDPFTGADGAVGEAEGRAQQVGGGESHRGSAAEVRGRGRGGHPGQADGRGEEGREEDLAVGLHRSVLGED